MMSGDVIGLGRYLYATLTISQGNCRTEKRALFAAFPTILAMAVRLNYYPPGCVNDKYLTGVAA
jgi:hypothetical protein